jgi:hypothetical protein
MNSKRLFFVLLGSLVLLLGVSIGLTYYGGKLLTTKGDTLVEKKLEQEVLASRQVAVLQAQKDIETYSDLADIARSIVPQENDQARTVREIINIAEASNVPIGSIDFPKSALGEARKKTSKSKASTPVDPATSQLTAVEGTDGLYAMEITISSPSQQPARYTQLLSFLEGLENNRRTAHVTSIDIDPDATTPSLVKFTIKLNVYIKL